jgi:hypothetical protein
MRHFLPDDDHPLERMIRRVDRAAHDLNPYLFVVAIGLAALYLTSLLAVIDTTAITFARDNNYAAPSSQAAKSPAENSR